MVSEPSTEIHAEKVIDNFMAAKKTEHARIMQETGIERTWWPVDTRFLRRESAQNGQLVKVPHEGDNYQLIWTLRKSREDGGEPDELRPQALSALERIVDIWAETMRAEGKDPNGIRLAVTSLYRDEALQASLNVNSATKDFAAPQRESSHLAGAAMDISMLSYYTLGDGGKYEGVNNTMTDGRYSRIVPDTLGEVLAKEAATKRINLVVENRITPTPDGMMKIPSVFHICVNPNPPATTT